MLSIDGAEIQRLRREGATYSAIARKYDVSRQAVHKAHRKWFADQSKRPDDSPSGFVYFVKAPGENGLVKIGWAVDPWKRLSTLQCGSPVELQLVACVPGGPADERAMHRRFASLRAHGEWFRLRGDLRTTIREFAVVAVDTIGLNG
jgi:hypothetical protein